jgi:hypothetical protein
MSQNEVHAKSEVHILIDRKEYTSPNPTTGHALYILGNVPQGYVLFRETHGRGDDELIQDTSVVITLHEGEKFYTAQSTLNPGS